jgi:hypothetical protein
MNQREAALVRAARRVLDGALECQRAAAEEDQGMAIDAAWTVRTLRRPLNAYPTPQPKHGRVPRPMDPVVELRRTAATLERLTPGTQRFAEVALRLAHKVATHTTLPSVRARVRIRTR